MKRRGNTNLNISKDLKKISLGIKLAIIGGIEGLVTIMIIKSFIPYLKETIGGVFTFIIILFVAFLLVSDLFKNSNKIINSSIFFVGGYIIGIIILIDSQIVSLLEGILYILLITLFFGYNIYLKRKKRVTYKKY